MSDDDALMTDDELAAIQARVDAVWPGPWRSFVEGRDMLAGSHFIRIADGEDHADIWMAPEWTDHLDGPLRRPGPQERQVWFEAHYDFVACARQDIPRLLAEVRRLRQQMHNDL